MPDQPSGTAQPINAPHSDAEMEQPQLLSTMRLAAIAQQIMQQWGAYLVPGARRFQRNGGVAVAQLGLRAQRYEDVLRQIVDPSYIGSYDDEAIVNIYRGWAQHALEALNELRERESLEGEVGLGGGHPDASTGGLTVPVTPSEDVHDACGCERCEQRRLAGFGALSEGSRGNPGRDLSPQEAGASNAGPVITPAPSESAREAS